MGSHASAQSEGREGCTRQRDLQEQRPEGGPTPAASSAATQASAAMNGSFMPWTRARSGPAALSSALGS